MQESKYGPENPDITYIPHKYDEHLFDTGDAVLNYATTGSPDKPAIVLIPGQTESWWGYEKAMGILSDYFQVFAVDLRGQGRSSRTPGRYTFDNFGNDLVKFITFVIARPVVVSGLSSGGVIAAWLSAYAPPGIIRGAHYEDPPLFSCELTPAYGSSLRQGVGATFKLWSTYLGDQWCIGDWEGMLKSARDVLPAGHLQLFEVMYGKTTEPPQHIKEYDPEWAKAFVTGTVGTSCDHARMLSRVKCPVLFTHHFSQVDEQTGNLMGASTVHQVDQVERLVKNADQPFTRLSFPQMGHSMHGQDPELFVRVLVDWEKTLPTEAKTRKNGVFARN
jgi:pimeloyl-ACP methyl ester carboxylesterase